LKDNERPRITAGDWIVGGTALVLVGMIVLLLFAGLTSR